MKREANLKYNVLEIKLPDNAADTLRQVIGFLQLFLSETLARYQKCQAVLDLARQLDIHLEYIAPYSNLNLIERLWKFVKGELASKYYTDFGAFSFSTALYQSVKTPLPLQAKTGELRLKLLQMFSACSITFFILPIDIS